MDDTTMTVPVAELKRGDFFQGAQVINVTKGPQDTCRLYYWMKLRDEFGTYERFVPDNANLTIQRPDYNL